MWQRVGWVLAAVLVLSSEARAGMPSFTLTDVASMRIQAISLFLVVLLGCAWVVQRIWNAARADFPAMPWLSYRRALGLLTLWGLLFVLVLTMISGARELLTPGAWKKVGVTYALNEPKPPPAPGPGRDLDSTRRQGIDDLRFALWNYAATHEGAFPPDDQVPEVLPDAWRVPGAGELRYVYRGGLRLGGAVAPLAIEPGVFETPTRLVLWSDGSIRPMRAAEIEQAITKQEAH